MSVRNRLGGLKAGIAAAALLLTAPALAQTPVAADPDDVILDELVVTARYGGPAWWTVSDADTTVYVLGVPSLAPKHMEWDQTLFMRRLQGANAVILPFQDIRVKTKGMIGAAFNYVRLRSSQPYETSLDGPTRIRFVAARTRLGQEAKHYGTQNALAAGLMLATDYRDKNELTNTDPAKLVKYLAQQAHVPVVARTYDLGPLMGAILRTSPAAGRACFDEVLAQVEAGAGVTRAAAKAWAVGDVRAALDNERTYERCITLVPGAQAFDARMKADEAAAIVKALQTPGHAIALVPLRPLLSKGGVLDRLRDQGFAVRVPGEEP